MGTTYVRFPGSKIQHFLASGSAPKTLCGKDAKGGAKYQAFKGNLNKDCAQCRKNKK